LNLYPSCCRKIIVIEFLAHIITSTISRITNAVASEVVSWQNRPLEDLYLIVWMDGIVFKVRENSKVINKTVYLAVGLNRDGRKEVLCNLHEKLEHLKI